MVKFDGKIVEFGFGAVGKSFFEKLSKEIEYDENKFYVISRDKGEFGQYINLGGMASNFITKEITKDNYKEVFGDFYTIKSVKKCLIKSLKIQDK